MLRDFSRERKEGQAKGEIPEWYTSAGWQMFAEKYLFEASTVKEQMQRIAKTFAAHCDEAIKPDFWQEDVFTAGKTWEQVFFDMMWKGHYIPSTPQMANTGTTRGCTVSCSGGYIKDSVVGFYDAYREAAVLTKQGFGTSYYLGDITPAGTQLPEGGKAGGVLPVLKGMIAVMEDITQTNRRGSVACSLEVTHKDFDIVADWVMLNPDGANIGWIITDKFMRKLDRGEKEAIRKWNKMLYIKMRSGRGYFTFIDKLNRHLAEPFKKAGLKVHASNLCVAPETQILTDRGYQIISDLEGLEVNVWNGQEFSKTTVVKTGIGQNLIKVNTDFGHELECTPYHKFYVLDECNRAKIVEKRAIELKAGDKLIKYDLPVIEGTETLSKAYTNGFFSGDGCFFKGNSMVYLYHAKRLLKPYIEHEGNWYEDDKQNRTIAQRVKGLKDKFFVPDSSYTIQSRLEWLAGFLDADGVVARNGTNHSLQASSIEFNFLKEVQLMLQTLGVPSKVCDFSEEGLRAMPANDGSGGMKDFFCQTSYRLLISSSGLYKLASLGFKTNRLVWDKRLPQRDAERFVTVREVSDNGRKDDTYCFTESKRGMGMFNGILTGQCQEIVLPANEEYSFSCVLSSLNLAKYREWSPNLEFLALVMLDCSVDDFLLQARGKAGMEKVVKFTEDFRALGLGTLGLHTLMQQEEIVVGSIASYQLNHKIYSRLDQQTKLATEWLAKVKGEPKGCEGFGWRNATRIAQAPNKSSSILGGGVSEGVGLDSAMVYTQQTAAGEVFRVNAKLLSIMKELGVYDDKHVREVNNAKGSVQSVSWLTQAQKDFLRTGFEVRVEDVLQLASQRQPFIDQGQSINLNLTENDSGQTIGALHKLAAEDENILTLYYIISMRDAGDIGKSRGECEVCAN